MNIYFACSITGGREFESVYKEIVRALLADGHEIPTAHLAESTAVTYEKDLTPEEVYQRDVTWIQNSDALIAEVSVPSHGVGYEIAYALNLGKPVLCLYQQDRKVSKMITGNADIRLCIEQYISSREAIEKAQGFLSQLR